MTKVTITSCLVISLAAVGLISACSGGGSDDPPVAVPVKSAEFAFDQTPADSPLYVRVDRTGVPGLATALLSKATNVTVTGVGGGVLNPANAANTFNDQRDQLNRGDPVNDARDFAGVFVAGPQSNSLKNIHFKIGRELRALGLTPCSTEPAGGAATNADVNVDVCVAQAAPVILPDVMVYDFSKPPGFPNGRTFDDPVIDRILSAALLKISSTDATPAPHNLNTLVGVIDTWNGPASTACPDPCKFTGDETGVVSPAAFPYLRPLYP